MTDIEKIIEILDDYTVDEIGETRPYIDPDLKKDIAEEIVKKLNTSLVGESVCACSSGLPKRYCIVCYESALDCDPF
jgi:hypothetical protein